MSDFLKLYNKLHKIEIGTYFDELAKLYDKKIAIIDYSNENIKPYTYIEISNEIKKYHTHLKRFLNFQDDVVYINKNSIEHIFLLFGCLRGGFRFVPINPRLKENEIIKMLTQLKVKLLIYGDEFRGNIEEIKSKLNIFHVYHINEFKNEIKKIDKLVDFEKKTSFNDDWVILFTSGTTGIPKAARIPYRMVFFNIIQTIIFWELCSNDSSVIHTPFFHAGGLNVFTTPLLSIGGCLYLLDSFNVKKLFDLINEKRINLLFAVPTMYKMMIDDPDWNKLDLSNMKIVISGGAPCPDVIINEFEKKGIVLKQGFGMTEVGVNCFFISEEDAKLKKGSVGKPMIFLETTLVDPLTNTKIENEGEGVLYFKGFTVFNGYENISIEKVFDEEFGFCSGDVAYRDSEGYYWIKGRVKDIIIRGGENIYPVEIEKEVYELSYINECSLFGINDDYWGEIPVLAVKFQSSILRTQYRDKIMEITAFLKKKLSSYKIPHYIFVIDDFEKTSSGKIMKEKLKEIFIKKQYIDFIQVK